MENSFIKPMPHVDVPPLRIERDYPSGREVIVIEGVHYDAEYFRTFAHPETNVLYQVQRRDDAVWLTTIQNEEQAKEFFENVGEA